MKFDECGHDEKDAPMVDAVTHLAPKTLPFVSDTSIKNCFVMFILPVHCFCHLCISVSLLPMLVLVVLLVFVYFVVSASSFGILRLLDLRGIL